MRKVLAVRDVAQILGISPHAVRMRVYRGQLPARKLGGRLVFLAEELEHFFKGAS